MDRLSLVTVIVPVYNCEKYIEKCILSVLGQTYSQLELILIDDGSADGSAEICKRYQSQYENIKYIYQENSGSAVARNKGIQQSKGDFFVFIDGDDFISEDMIAKLMSNMDEGIDIVCCSYNSFDEQMNKPERFYDKDFVVYSNQEKSVLYNQLMISWYCQTEIGSTAIGVPWGKLYRRDFIIKNCLMFNPELRRMQDNIFNMYAFYYSNGIKYINLPKYNYRIDHIQSYSSGYSPEQYQQVLAARNEFFQKHPDAYVGDVKNYSKYEKIYFMYMSLKNIVSKKIKYSQFNKMINEMKSNKIYGDMLEKECFNVLSVKYKIFYLLLKSGNNYGIYLLLKFKNR